MRFNPSTILFRYVTFSYLRCFCIVLLTFLAITSMLEYMELARKFSTTFHMPYGTILSLTVFYSVPIVSSFFPFTAFASTILFFATMHPKLEITSIKVLGGSAYDIVKCLAFGTCLIGVLYLTVFDCLSVFSTNQTKIIENRIDKKNDDKQIVVTNRGIWFRDISQENSYIIYAKSFSENGKKLISSSFFEFDQDHNFLGTIYSESALVQNGNWILKNARKINIDGSESEFQTLEIPTVLSINKINKITANPKSISIWSISRYISMIDKVGLSSLKYKIHFLHQISSFFQMIALTLLGCVFCLGYNPRNAKRYFLKVVCALSIAFPLYFMNNVILAFGENGKIPIPLAVSLMPLLTFIICAWLLSKK